MPRSCANCSAVQSEGTIACTSARVIRPFEATSSFRRRAVEELHHQKRMVLIVDVEVENRDDVGMAEAGAGAALAEEPVARARSAVLAADDLDRDLVAEQRPARPIHGTHPTFGQQRQNLVAIVQDLPGREHGSIRPLVGSGLGVRGSAVRSRTADSSPSSRPSPSRVESEPRAPSLERPRPLCYCTNPCSLCFSPCSSSRFHRRQPRPSFARTSGRARRRSSRSICGRPRSRRSRTSRSASHIRSARIWRRADLSRRLPGSRFAQASRAATSRATSRKSRRTSSTSCSA